MIQKFRYRRIQPKQKFYSSTKQSKYASTLHTSDAWNIIIITSKELWKAKQGYSNRRKHQDKDIKCLEANQAYLPRNFFTWQNTLKKPLRDEIKGKIRMEQQSGDERKVINSILYYKCIVHSLYCAHIWQYCPCMYLIMIILAWLGHWMYSWSSV